MEYLSQIFKWKNINYFYFLKSSVPLFISEANQIFSL